MVSIYPAMEDLAAACSSGAAPLIQPPSRRLHPILHLHPSFPTAPSPAPAVPGAGLVSQLLFNPNFLRTPCGSAQTLINYFR